MALQDSSTKTAAKRQSASFSSPSPYVPTTARTSSVKKLRKRPVSGVLDSPSPSPSVPKQQLPASPGTPGRRVNNNMPLKKNRDSIKVIARFRPQFNKEKLKVDKESTLKFNDSTSLSIGGEHFNFDRVFDHQSTQEEIFKYSVEQTVEDLFLGYNGTVLAYGQTGSGKTYTMMGTELHDSQRGMIPRICDAIFEQMSKNQKDEDPTEFRLSASYMEIYMEQARDLLASEGAELPLLIQEDGSNGVFIRNLTKRYITSSEEVYMLLKKGSRQRAVGSTEMNEESSRSHAIFQLDLIQENISEGIKKSKLFLVDLAGSEKVSKTGASGQTLEEAKKINSSLTHLGIVINALTDSKSSHIPYRDSKLTRILQHSLGGNSRTSLIINCSPAACNEAETLSTLRFGTRAKKIKNKAHVNSEPSQLDLLKRIEQLELLNAKHELRSNELELELDLWKTGINKISPDTPPLPPPKNAPITTNPEDLKKILFLENRIKELAAIVSYAPSITSKQSKDTPLIKQLEESQSLNSVILEDLNNKCTHLLEMQLEIDKLSSQLQYAPDEDKTMALEQSLMTFTTKVAELEHQNHMLQMEIKTTKGIAETRQERIKTLEELLKDSQTKIYQDTASFEFKLFSLKERVYSARKLSASSTSPVFQRQQDANHRARDMSKIDENGGVSDFSSGASNSSIVVHKRVTSTQSNHSSHGSEESLMSIKGTHTRATSVTSSVGSLNGNSGMRAGLNLNIVKPNLQSLSTD